jgi:arylformamidase
MMWDLTRPLSEHMRLYPGMPAPKFVDLAMVSRDGYGMSEWTFRNHLGTHLDGPTHFVDGKTLDQYGPERLLTEAAAVHLEQLPAGTIIGPRMLEAALGPNPPGAVVLVTGQWSRWGQEDYFGPFPVLDAAGVVWLLERGIELVAVDAPSVDPVDTDTFPIHRQLLGADCLILENLAWQPDLPGRFVLAALPMLVEGANGAPCRALAWDALPAQLAGPLR